MVTAISASPMMYLGYRRAHRFGGLLFIVLVLVLVVLAVVLIVRMVQSRKPPLVDAPWGPSPSAAPPMDPVLSELRMRYARGEIGRDEYLQRVADLGYGPAATPPPRHSGPTMPMTGGPPG